MNKKFYLGMMSFGLAATFWACGSGEIFKADEDDKTMGMEMEDPAFGVVKDVLTRELCPQCFEGTPESSSSSKQQPPPASSATFSSPSSSISQQPQSSSSEFQINLSSSTPYSYTPRSSTQGPGPGIQSGISAVVSTNGVGTCAPDPALATVDVGVKTTWKFTRGASVATTDLIKASFAWTFEGGTPSTAEATGASGLSQSVSYATSGSHGATVTVTLGGSSYPVTCSPVHVNGAKITGCTCTTASKSVDFTATPDVAWAVTGCTTSPGLTLSYEWDGAPGSEAYVKTFTAANPGYVPKLVVKNNDNTMIEVKTCPAVKITDGPEYQITTTQKAGAIDLPKGTSAVVVSVQNDGYVFCQIDRAKANSTTGAFKGTVNKVALSGNDYKEIQVNASGIPVGSTLEFDIDVPLTCGVR